MLSPFPLHTQAEQCLADGLIADPSGDQTLLEADFSRQFQGPQTAWLVEFPRTAVQQGTQFLGPLIIKGRMAGMGAARTLFQGLHATVLEGSNRIAHSLVVAAKESGYCRSPFASGTGQQDLAATHSEAVC
jgi:hypothetical protein